MPHNNANPSTCRVPSFLDEVVDEIVAHPLAQARQLHRMALVLPSHRASTTLRKTLISRLGVPARLPKFYALSGFLEELSPLKAADPLEVMARMHRLMKDLDGAMGFDRFVPWASVVLQDFASVDHELADVDKVFQNLADIQGIEDWSFGEAPWSEDQKAFERQWRRLPGLYRALHQDLAQDGMTTRAHVARLVSAAGLTDHVDHLIAAGLTTLTKAEWAALDNWKRVGKLTMMWDGDESYVHDPHNEAGLFIRQHVLGKTRLSDRIGQGLGPQVNLVSCASAVSQAQAVRELLAPLDEESLDQTLVVLPDGSSLGTLLQALPPSDRGYNVTMGLAFHESPVQAWIEQLFLMLDTRGNSWRYDHVQSLHAHPVMQLFHRGEKLRQRDGWAFYNLAKTHRAWVNHADFEAWEADELAEELRKLGELRVDDATSFLERLLAWSADLEPRLGSPLPLAEVEDEPSKALETGMNDPILGGLQTPRDEHDSSHDSSHDSAHDPSQDAWILAGWQRFRAVLGVMHRLQVKHAPMKEAREVRHMVKRLLRLERLDMLGEPAQGVQIMGLTETRALDYDRVIVLDMNEGIVPKASQQDSFLPHDLRSHWGMPGQREREARYAYLIHRLLNRSSEVHFLYRNSPDGKEGGEPSRYLLQIEGSFHDASGRPYLEVKRTTRQLPLPAQRPSIPELEVTPSMREALKRWASRGMSPSAINTMLACPRNFAFRYLWRMGEATEIQTAMEANTLGSVVHWVMEHGIREAGAVGHILTTHHLDHISQAMDDLMARALAEEYNADLVQRGENVLQLEIARATLAKLLRQERLELTRGDSPPFIDDVEQPLNSSHEGQSFGPMSFGGKADRSENIHGVPRVVDYKTGKVTTKDLQLEGDWTTTLNEGSHGKALQLLVYATMVLAHLDPVSQARGVVAGIRSGRNAREGLLSLTIDGSPLITKPHAETFLAWLSDKLCDLSAEGTTYAHDPKSHYCEHCVVLDPVELFSF
ncbi:MAG: PD-(D/E)XK nuclease family protein [Bacteroidetes bacterium]|nr:PD-(D/E)XK nuclease family protein [Bacteroidota bacterium]MDA0904061.1 PD-(D/E)XK nuclease family protein [Bacteroidota bacterium]MDA1242697.1 PD-(D/E)XK nuclease family protein [Bacteroidota bacterium]